MEAVSNKITDLLHKHGIQPHTHHKVSFKYDDIFLAMKECAELFMCQDTTIGDLKEKPRPKKQKQLTSI